MTDQSWEMRAEGLRSAAVGINHGIVSLGDNALNTVVNLPEALPDPGGTPAPPRTWRVRGGRGAGVFVGREAQLDALADAYGGAQVIVGLGGSGKSTIARVFAEQRRGHDNPVWWIDGRSKEQIDLGLAELANRLAPILAGVPVPYAAAWARSWLAVHQEWLLVLDDVIGPEDVRDLIDELPEGNFLLTSRQGEGWLGLAGVVPVGDLSGPEATRLLELVMRKVSRDEPDLSGAAELCERLGRLPLAIEQAGAFIALNADTPAAYLEMLNRGGTSVLDHGAQGFDPKRTVTRIWRVTFDRLAENGLAAEILRVLAWFAPTDIPRTLEFSASEVEVRDALNLLAAYHMVMLAKDAISVHPLVQEVTRTASEEDPHRTAEQIESARATATAMLFAAATEIGSEPEHWPAQRRLFPHIEALITSLRTDQTDAEVAALLGLSGRWKEQQGDYPGAMEHLWLSLQILSGIIATTPAPEAMRFTAQNFLALASAYRRAGEEELGLVTLEGALEFATESFGATSELAVRARAELAAARSAGGDDETAIAELRAVLEHCVAEYGENSMQARRVGGLLGAALYRAGQIEESVEYYVRNYLESLWELGPKHLETLAAARDYAVILRVAKRFDEALTLQDEIAERRAEVLGSKHPDTLDSLKSLAITKASANDLSGGRSLLERVLADQEEVLGSDHPSTRDTRDSLAFLIAQMETNPDTASNEPSAEERLH